MKERILFRIDLLLERIDLVLKDTKDASFEDNNILVRATCFSIAQIGEILSSIKKELKDVYPYYNWDLAVKLQDMLVFDCENGDTETLYSIIQKELPQLKNDFTRIRSEIVPLII